MKEKEVEEQGGRKECKWHKPQACILNKENLEMLYWEV